MGTQPNRGATQSLLFVFTGGEWVPWDGGSAPSGLVVDQGAAGTDPWLVTNRNTPLTPSSPVSASVGVTSASVVAANPNRTGLILVNLSSNHISFGLGVAAVLDAGITLVPNGVWNMGWEDFTTGAINAIASLAGSTLAIQEFST